MTRRTRPTLRCVTEDLALPIPPANLPLDEIDHPIATKAVRQFSDPAGPRERIRSVDDQVLYKVKVQRWRGAVWLDTSGTQPWLITAGRREDGSADDFYEALTAAGRANRARYNRTHSPALTTDTHTADLLPSLDDLDRYRVEDAVRLIRTIRDTVEDLTRASLLDGKEHTGTAAGTGIGILVRADDGHETYVAVRITGPAPPNVTHIILNRVPGCEREGWYPEPAMPTRPTARGEQVWSNIMDPTTAAKLLSE